MFNDRKQAGEELAERLAGMQIKDPVVLALPRGGVPVAREIARRLSAPLDLISVRKIGAPSQPELAIGAVVDGDPPIIVMNDELVSAIGFSRAELDAITDIKISELQQRRRLYMGGRQPLPLKDRTAIVVDDGIATGASLEAALAGLKHRQPVRIILAVPVAPVSTLRKFQLLVDDVVCLETPEPFHAVGLHYRMFQQVSDQEVISTLSEFNRHAD